MSLSGGIMKLILVCLLLLSGCSSNPTKEITLSKEEFAEIYKRAWMKGYVTGECESSVTYNKYAKAEL